MKISSGYQRTNPKRALCFKIAAMCGHVFAGREYRKIMQEKIAGCQSEISKIPNLRLVTWGSGQQMGRFIPKPVATPPGPDLPETPAAAGGWSPDFAARYIVPAGMEDDGENNNGNRLANRLDAPPIPFVDFPLRDASQDQNQDQGNDSHVQNQGDDSHSTIIVSEDEEEMNQQETLGERVGPDGQANRPEESAGNVQRNPTKSVDEVRALEQRREGLYSNPYHKIIVIDID